MDDPLSKDAFTAHHGASPHKNGDQTVKNHKWPTEGEGASRRRKKIERPVP